jgi:hypothetical protein
MSSATPSSWGSVDGIQLRKSVSVGAAAGNRDHMVFFIGGFDSTASSSLGMLGKTRYTQCGSRLPWMLKALFSWLQCSFFLFKEGLWLCFFEARFLQTT